MTATPTGTTLVQEALQAAHAVVVGRPGAAQQVADLAPHLSRQASATYRRSQEYRPNSGSPAIDLMRAAGNSATVSTAGHIRAALATRPGMDPHDYLKSMRLATLPAWPLPDEDAFEVVVYMRSAPGLRLLTAVGASDEAEIERIAGQLAQGPSDFSARSLGD